MPDSLDRSDRFFTNVERVMREANLPALSADSRKFFTTTSAQIGQMSSNMEKVWGPVERWSSSPKRRGPPSRPPICLRLQRRPEPPRIR